MFSCGADLRQVFDTTHLRFVAVVYHYPISSELYVPVDLGNNWTYGEGVAIDPDVFSDRKVVFHNEIKIWHQTIRCQDYQ